MGGLRELRFGLSRSHAGDRVVEGARQFTDVLGDVLDVTVRVHVAFDYQDLLRAFLAGTVEVAWLPPLLLAQALQHSAFLAAICEREGQLDFRSSLLVHADGPIHDVSELRGRRAAWVELHSSSGHLLPKRHLQRAGIELGEELFAGSFSQSWARVASGEADLCAGFARGPQPPPPHPALRVLALTDAIPNEGIVLGAKLPHATQLRLAAALCSLDAHADGVAAMQTLFQATRLVAPTQMVRHALTDLLAVFGSIGAVAKR